MNTQHNPTNEPLQSLIKLPVLWLILFTQTSAFAHSMLHRMKEASDYNSLTQSSNVTCRINRP